MAKQELPGMTGKGVETLVIDEIDKAISKYERKKEARCKESPGEIEAKTELREALHKHKAKLPTNGDGFPYYRHEERDYVLAETMKVKKVESVDIE